MMKDWSDFNRIHKETLIDSDEKKKASVIRYLSIKLVDNWISIVLIALLVFFSILGFNSNDSTKNSWALHAGELCLGVFLGLFKSTK
jgi:hypothetical protein